MMCALVRQNRVAYTLRMPVSSFTLSRGIPMRNLRLACALAIAVFGATAMAEAAGKPGFVVPSDPPDSLLAYACSLLPSAAAAWVGFCAD